MTPETSVFMTKAEKLLREAEIMIDSNLAEAAARTAYLAAFHAAQGLIFERTGKISKTHNGVRTEFHRLLQGIPFGSEHIKAFLATGYELKTIADYGVDPNITVLETEALQALRSARSFVRSAEAALLKPSE